MRRLLLSAALVAAVPVLPGHAQQSSPVPLTPSSTSTLPAVNEHRYRMSAKIRPLLLFWIGRDNVGGARITWRRGADGSRGWELLIGSDPNRAPAHVNRWGYVREEISGEAVSMLGVMKQSDEQSLQEARAHVEDKAAAAYAYKLIRTQVSGGQSSAQVVSSAFPRDYTYRDLAALLRAFESQPVRVSGPKQVRIGAEARPGFLVAITDLIHDTVWAFQKRGAPGLTARKLAYAYNGQIYDLSLAAPHVLKNARYGDRTYPTLLDADFEVRNRATGGKEQFSIVYGTDGPFEEVPVFISYQPRWWFKAELLLDDADAF